MEHLVFTRARGCVFKPTYMHMYIDTREGGSNLKYSYEDTRYLFTLLRFEIRFEPGFEHRFEPECARKD